MPESRPARSGCAVVFGVLLIAIGTLFLVHNLLGYVGVSTIRFGREAFVWYARYWPLLIIAWGIYKVYERSRNPGRAYATGAEIVLLVWVLGLGFVARAAEEGVQELSTRVSLDEVAGVFGPELLGPSHRFELSETFEPGEATGIDIVNRNGHVVVQGTDEPLVRVELAKRVRSFSEDEAASNADAVELSFRPGRRAKLEIVRGEAARAVATDVTIHLPRNLGVRVDNRRGSVQIAAIDGPVSVESSHGEIEANELGAGADVKTSHAAIRLEHVTGNVNAETRHGRIHAQHIDGALKASTRHSGIAAENVTGRASLRTGHGQVSAIDIGSDLDIDASQSEVTVERARGAVTIASRYRPVFVSQVEGRLKIVTRNANVMVRGARENVAIENQYRPIHIADVSGTVTVDGKQCSVTIERVDGAIRVESSYEPVTVVDFGGSVHIASTHAAIDVAATALSGAISLETTYEDVRLSLPADASAEVTVRAKNGTTESDFAEITHTGRESETDLWKGSLGTGAHPVTIATSYSDISLGRGTP